MSFATILPENSLEKIKEKKIRAQNRRSLLFSYRFLITPVAGAFHAVEYRIFTIIFTLIIEITMQNNNLNNPSSLFDLVSRFEAMAQKGNTPYLDEYYYNRLIDYYQKEFLYEKALQVTEIAVEHYPFTIEFLFRRVQLYHCLGLPQKAMSVLDSATMLSPESFDVKLLRASLLTEMDETEEALSILEHLKNHVSAGDREQLSMVFYHEALVHEKAKSYESMYFLLKKAIELDFKNNEALEKMWLCVEQTGKHMDSIAFHKKVTDEEPYSYWGWFNLGNAYDYTCQYEKAIRAYDFAIVINENFELAYRNCAEVCLNLSRFDQALKYYQEVLERFEMDGDILMKVGICNLKLNKWAAAKKYLLMAKEEDDFNDEVYFHLGLCFLEEGNLKKATLHFKKAISNNPFKEEYYIHLAKAYQASGNMERAEKYFKKATDTGPDLFDNWLQYAGFLVRDGRPAEALQVLREAEDLIGEIELVYAQVACLLLLNKQGEAKYVLGELLAEDHRKHTVLFEIAPLLQENKELKDFILSYQPDQSLYPLE